MPWFVFGLPFVLINCSPCKTIVDAVSNYLVQKGEKLTSLTADICHFRELQLAVYRLLAVNHKKCQKLPNHLAVEQDRCVFCFLVCWIFLCLLPMASSTNKIKHCELLLVLTVARNYSSSLFRALYYDLSKLFHWICQQNATSVNINRPYVPDWTSG